MKSYFLKLLLIFCFISVNVLANEMFWEVNGTNGGKVYILGSLEIGHKDIYPFSADVEEAFNRSNYLILQLLKGTNNELFKYDEMYVKGRYEEHDSIVKHLSTQTYAHLKKWLKQQKLPTASMNRFQPWVVALTLSWFDMALWGDEKLLSIENHFYQKARRSRKGVYSLERVSDAFSRLQEPDDDFQEALLQSFMDTRVSSELVAQERLKKYQEGNLSYFKTVLVDPFVKYPFVKETVLDDQNAAYLKKIMKYRGSKKGRHYFLIIGLEHLLGEDGILAQLKKANVEMKAY